jgi:nucleotide-binding universal stress UspA family protein
MNTLLIPVDSSTTAENLFDFAAEWAKTYQYKRILLLRTFYDTLFDDVVVSLEYGNVNFDFKQKEREDATKHLFECRKQLSSKVNAGIEVEALTSELPLMRAVIEVIEDEDVDMVMVGSDPETQLNDNLVSGNVIRIARVSPVKVLIVPSGYQYKEVKTALVPIDMVLANTVERIHSIHGSELWSHVQFKVLNVDPKQHHLHPTEKFRQAEEKLHYILKNVKHQLHYTSEENIVDGIMKFVKENPVELIMALPGKHSFLYSLTHSSISEGIYRVAHQPVLILK